MIFFHLKKMVYNNKSRSENSPTQKSCSWHVLKKGYHFIERNIKENASLYLFPTSMAYLFQLD